MLNGMNGDFLDQFALPDGAAEALKKQDLRNVAIEPGVSLMSGHDHGVPFRFFTFQDFDKLKSDKCGWEQFNEEIMIQWFNDRYTKPTERVRLLVKEAPHLLSFNAITGKTRGQYAEAYDRFKAGIQAEGTPLDLWATKYGTLSDSEIATLKANEIYTVEQFGACPEGKIRSKFPAEIVAAFERAILYVAGKDVREQTAKQLEEVLEVKKENENLKADIAKLQDQMSALMAMKAPAEPPIIKKGQRK